jgi:hypothetical protein
MAVLESEKDYFRRLGVWKEKSHREATAHHMSLSLSERLQRSWELYLRYRETARLDLREDDPSPFYKRARRLKMIEE